MKKPEIIVQATRFEARPEGIWTAEGMVDFRDVYRECRTTLRVALQLGRWRAYAAGTWWTFKPL